MTFKRDLTDEEYAAILAQAESEGGGEKGESARQLSALLRELVALIDEPLPVLQTWEADAIWERLREELERGELLDD